MAKKLSNVLLMPAVEGISRKIALRRETCFNKKIEVGDLGVKNNLTIPGTTYMGIVSKTRNVIGTGKVRVNYLFMRKASTAPNASTDQLDQRAAFKEGLEWARAAMTDLSVYTNNQLKFQAAIADFSKKIKGVSAKGYQGMFGWLSAIAIRLAADNALPQTHALPDFDA